MYSITESLKDNVRFFMKKGSIEFFWRICLYFLKKFFLRELRARLKVCLKERERDVTPCSQPTNSTPEHY